MIEGAAMGGGDPQDFGLPHREPFVFIDEVRDLVPGESASARKCFSPDDPMFRGHFPGDPMVPGVILTEALAQAAGIAGGAAGRRFLLSAIRQMKFPTAARPAERIDLEARRTGTMGALWMFEVRAAVDGRTVAEGHLVLNEIPSPSGGG